MNNKPVETSKKADPPVAEELRVQSDEKTAISEAITSPNASKVATRPHRTTYRPSHKATFIGLAVVAAMLAINAGVILFLMRGQGSTESSANKEEVVISSSVLDSLGINRTPVSNLGTELIVGPDSRFRGKVTVAGDVSIAGQLKLNSKFTASEASLTKLDAGDASLGKLSVNGDGTMTNMNLRQNLAVAGSTQLQGSVTIGQLLTVNNNVNITGNLSLGGTFSARGVQVSSLIADTTLTVGGHIISRGYAPAVSSGPAVGSNGTVSISGNDVSGTVAVNVGTGGSSGIVAFISFLSSYGTTPHVVVTAVGSGAGSIYVNRTASGFSIGVNGALAPGGYAFDYIVMQ